MLHHYYLHIYNHFSTWQVTNKQKSFPVLSIWVILEVFILSNAQQKNWQRWEITPLPSAPPFDYRFGQLLVAAKLPRPDLRLSQFHSDFYFHQVAK